MPSACAPTIGRVVSNVLIAACTFELLPSRARASRASSFSAPPSRQEPGTRTSSKSTSPVCEARMPIFFSFFPPVTPGPEVWVDTGHDDVDVWSIEQPAVRDERLLAVDHPVVTVLLGGRAEAR